MWSLLVLAMILATHPVGVAQNSFVQDSVSMSEIISASEARVRAGAAGDEPTVKRLLARDAISVTADGAVARESTRFLYPAERLDGPAVRRFGDGAVVIASVGPARVMQVWTGSSGSWQLVAEQLTPLTTGTYVPAPSAPPTAPAGPPDAIGPDAEAILAAERIFREIVDLGRSPGAGPDPEYVGIVRDGQVESAQARVRRAPGPQRDGPRTLQAEHQLRVRVYGAVGVITGFVFNRGETARFLRVFARRPDGWKLVSSQSTTVR